MSPAVVDIYMWGHHMATITDPPGPRVGFRDRNRVRGSYAPQLEYTATWLDSHDSIPLSLSVPLDRPPEAIKVGRYLDSLLPENPATLEDWHKRFGFNLDATTLEILQVVGEDVAGAAQFVPAGRTPSRQRQLIALRDSQVADLLIGAVANFRRRAVTTQSSSSDAGCGSAFSGSLEHPADDHRIRVRLPVGKHRALAFP